MGSRHVIGLARKGLVRTGTPEGLGNWVRLPVSDPGEPVRRQGERPPDGGGHQGLGPQEDGRP